MRLIDGDAMMQRLEEWNTSDSTDKALYNFTLHRILEQPTIEPERKKGRWEVYIISMLDGEGCRCSECRAEGVPYWDFCPNCGADMRGDNDETD